MAHRLAHPTLATHLATRRVIRLPSACLLAALDMSFLLALLKEVGSLCVPFCRHNLALPLDPVHRVAWDISRDCHALINSKQIVAKYGIKRSRDFTNHCARERIQLATMVTLPLFSATQRLLVARSVLFSFFATCTHRVPFLIVMTVQEQCKSCSTVLKGADPARLRRALKKHDNSQHWQIFPELHDGKRPQLFRCVPCGVDLRNYGDQYEHIKGSRHKLAMDAAVASGADTTCEVIFDSESFPGLPIPQRCPKKADQPSSAADTDASASATEGQSSSAVVRSTSSSSAIMAPSTTGFSSSSSLDGDSTHLTRKTPSHDSSSAMLPATPTQLPPQPPPPTFGGATMSSGGKSPWAAYSAMLAAPSPLGDSGRGNQPTTPFTPTPKKRRAGDDHPFRAVPPPAPPGGSSIKTNNVYFAPPPAPPGGSSSNSNNDYFAPPPPPPGGNKSTTAHPQVDAASSTRTTRGHIRAGLPLGSSLIYLLRARMEELHPSTADLGEALGGKSADHVEDLFAGRARATAAEIRRLSSALGGVDVGRIKMVFQGEGWN